MLLSSFWSYTSDNLVITMQQKKNGHRKIQCHKIEATRRSICRMFVCAITFYSAKTLKGSTTNRFFILYVTRSLLQTCSTSLKWQTSKLRTQHSQYQNSLLACACLHPISCVPFQYFHYIPSSLLLLGLFFGLHSLFPSEQPRPQQH